MRATLTVSTRFYDSLEQHCLSMIEITCKASRQHAGRCRFEGMLVSHVRYVCMLAHLSPCAYAKDDLRLFRFPS